MHKKIKNLSFALLLTAFAAHAADQTPPQPKNLEKVPEPPDSGITISKPDTKKKSVEKKTDGKTTEVKVNTGVSHYTLKANPEVGNAVPGTAAGNANRPAMFTLLEFGGPKESKEVETPAVLPPNPAASASAASAPAKK